MKPILYLHGFASGPFSSKARYFHRYLTDRGALVQVPDLAAGDFEHLTITGQLAVARRFLTGGPVCLIGSSMGGYLAALLAARHAEIERLVLLAPAGWRSSTTPKAVTGTCRRVCSTMAPSMKTFPIFPNLP
jgi:predicted esterase YcpF (UPF0227 family)